MSKKAIAIDGLVRPLLFVPPSPDCCQVCAATHEPEHAHNRDSLYYQMVFHQQYGRWPTWHDAVAHCTEDVREWWLQELRIEGVAVDEVR